MFVPSRFARPSFLFCLVVVAACQDLGVDAGDTGSPKAGPTDARSPDADAAVGPDVAAPEPDAALPDAALPDASDDVCPAACAEIADCAVVECTLLEAGDRETVYTGCTGYCPTFGASLALLTDSTNDCGRIVSTLSLNNPPFANTCGAPRE